MKAATKMIALQDASTTHHNQLNAQPKSANLSESSAIAISALYVVVFAIPVFWVIQVLNILDWGKAKVHQRLNRSEFNKREKTKQEEFRAGFQACASNKAMPVNSFIQ